MGAPVAQITSSVLRGVAGAEQSQNALAGKTNIRENS